MGYIIFDRSGKVVRHAEEASTEEDTRNLHRKEDRETDHTGYLSGEEEVMPRKRVPHK